MKKILFLLVVIASTFFSSCEDKYVSSGRNLYKLYYKKVLTDPESFKVYNESYRKTGEFDIEWTIDYGAKNQAGGMVRNTEKFKTSVEHIEIDGHMYHISELK